jgi:hypothetical protein
MAMGKGMKKDSKGSKTPFSKKPKKEKGKDCY